MELAILLELEIAIPGFRPFSPILNLGIGSVSIPGFRDYKNELKLYFFYVLNDRNKNFSRVVNRIYEH